MSQFMNYEQDEHIVTLTMNEPERCNPLTGNTAVREFLAVIDRIDTDRSVRAVILTGAGTAFSSGGKIHDMERHASGSMPGMEIRRDYRRGIQQLPLALFNLEVPVIAAVNGAAIGAELDLACMCDIRIGIIPGDGGAWLLPRIIGVSRAAELTFTGQMIDAQQALEWNLVSRVVPHDALLATAQGLARSRPSIRPTPCGWRSGCCAKACIAVSIRCWRCRGVSDAFSSDRRSSRSCVGVHGETAAVIQGIGWAQIVRGGAKQSTPWWVCKPGSTLDEDNIREYCR